MAYGVKYRCEYTDLQGVDWKVDILEDSYAGAISAMIASGDPLSIDYLTPGDDLTLSPIKGSMVTLNVECTTNFEYIGLYSEEDLYRPVNIYKDEVLYWTGWLSNEYTEPYDNVPYTVSITASDALGLLKNIPYDNAGAPYTGRDTETDIILRILGKIGHTTFTEFCNLYEDRMDDAVDDSPFDQTLIDNDLFIDADCYSVLQAILIKYNAVIRQKGGVFIIYRPTELIGDTVYGRIITSTTTTGTSMTPDKVIDRDGLALIDVEGGVLMYKPPMSTFTAKQDYGYKESWIDNHKFDPDKFDRTTDEFESWSTVGALDTFHPLQYRTGEPEGLLINPRPTGSYITQTFGAYAKESADVFRLEFDYKFINSTGSDASTVTLNFALFTLGGSYYYLAHPSTDDGVTAEWDSSPATVQITEASVPKGEGQWTTWSRYIAGLPEDGPLMVVFYPHATLSLCINDVRFYATSDNITYLKKRAKKKWWRWIPPLNIVHFFTYKQYEYSSKISDIEEVIERNYTVDNSVNGDESEQLYVLGDCEDTGIVNVLEQFKGSLGIQITGSLEQTAVDFVNAQASSYTAGGVIVTSSDNIVIFTSDTPGTNFTGSTTITNVSGTLAGTVATITANSAGTAQIETITLSGGGAGDTADVYILGLNWAVTYNTSLTQTAADFVTAWAADFVSFNITLTSDAEDLIFTEAIAYGGFTAPTITTTSGTLTGTVYHTQAATAATARVDHVTLTGTSGTANILCDGVTKLATFNTSTVSTHTVSWHTRGNTEALPLAELIGDEVADLYSVGRQMIQLNMYELTESLDIIKNLQDPLNLVGANNRVFAFNRGTLDCQAREWTIDIIEIGDK